MTRAAACGVVVASVPWAEPGSRSTRDFGTRVADERREPEDRKRFRTSRGAPPEDAAHRVAERLSVDAVSTFGGLTSIGVDETGTAKATRASPWSSTTKRHRAI